MIPKATDLIFIAFAALIAPTIIASAQESNPFAPPTRAWQQGAIYQNSVPTEFESHIHAETRAELESAHRAIDIDAIFVAGATDENLAPYVPDEYIQHSIFLPKGRVPLAALFGGSVEERDISNDFQRIIVSENHAFAYVNFRNLDHDDPRDLGIAAVEMHRFDEKTALLETQWEVLQNVSSHSPNPNTVFLLVEYGGLQCV